MSYSTKIATCSYCGARAALVLGRDRHELACDRCGAPLHDMKRLKVDDGKKSQEKQTLGHGLHKRPYHARDEYDDYKRRKKRKKRKSLMRYVLEEAVDAIEDIFD